MNLPISSSNRCTRFHPKNLTTYHSFFIDFFIERALALLIFKVATIQHYGCWSGMNGQEGSYDSERRVTATGKFTYKTYRLLDGSQKKLLSRIGNGQIIRLFDNTPYPKSDTDIVCPHFLELKWAYGCPYSCSWCYLMGTFRFKAWKRKDRRVLPTFKPRPKIERAVKSFINCMKHPAILNTGELADSLMGENQKPPFSKFIVELFQGTPHKVLFLTKGTFVKHFVENEWQKNAILSWSINAPEVARRFEKLAPTPIDRIEAARQVYERGYEVRIRVDPMVPVPGWKGKYEEVISAMFHNMKPERITLGTLRGLPATIAVAVHKEWVQYLTEKSNWGRKPAYETRLEMYSFAIEQIRKHRLKKIGICKDTKAIHQVLKERFIMDYRKMECNCID